MNASEVKRGAQLRMTDLRRGQTYDVIVLHCVGNKALVALDGNRERKYEVDVGFLAPRTKRED